MKHNGYIHSAGTEEAREAIAKKYGSESAPLTKDVRSHDWPFVVVRMSGHWNPC